MLNPIHRRDYWLCGWRLNSEIPLPELAPWSGDTNSHPIDVTIRVGSIPKVDSEPVFDTPVVRLSASGQCLVSIDGIARFLVEADSRQVTVELANSQSAIAASLFLLTTVVGILCHMRGLLPLHASSVRIGDEAVVFAGPSGSGKSTLAAGLVQRGHCLVGDDVAVIDTRLSEPVVWPAFPRLKLWRDALAQLDISSHGLERGRGGLERYQLPATVFREEPVRLGAIYAMSWVPEAHLERMTPLAGVRAIHQLYSVVYRGRVGEVITGRAALLSRIGGLLSCVPAYSWARPIDLGRLSSGVSAILERHARC